LRGRQGAKHHCFSVRQGLWHQSVGKALVRHAKPPRLGSLRIVLDGYSWHRWHTPATATRFAFT